MLINLKTSSEKKEQKIRLEIKERLPVQLDQCFINCIFDVKLYDDYYLIRFNNEAELQITCQRCLAKFSYPYINKTELAVCESDSIAEKLMNQFDCILSKSHQVDLQEIITDELHLYAPEAHLNHKECDENISKFIKHLD